MMKRQPSLAESAKSAEKRKRATEKGRELKGERERVEGRIEESGSTNRLICVKSWTRSAHPGDGGESEVKKKRKKEKGEKKKRKKGARRGRKNAMREMDCEGKI